MFGVLENNIFHVIRLASDRRLSEGLDRRKKTQALRSYLSQLSLDDVKTIQTIMYLGRDADYNESDDEATIYKKFREKMDKLGWEKKEIEINQMVEKDLLDNYLVNG